MNSTALSNTTTTTNNNNTNNNNTNTRNNIDLLSQQSSTQLTPQKTLPSPDTDDASVYEDPDPENGGAPSLTSNRSSTSPMETNASIAKEPIFKFGPYVPILRKANSIMIDPNGIVSYYNDSSADKLSNEMCQEVLPVDAIVEAPSLVTPLLLKKHSIWPKKISDLDTREKSTSEINPNQLLGTNDVNQQSKKSDDIQIIKIVDKDSNNRPNPSRPTNNIILSDYIRTTAIASLAKTSKASSNNPILTIEDYFKSSVGQLFLGIGLSQARELCLEGKVKQISKKIRKSGDNCTNYIEELELLREQLNQSRASNKVYTSDKILKCPHCTFKSEFAIVMSGHLEKPHQNQKREFLCNWCDYKTRDPNQIVFHCLMEHKQRCTVEKPIALHNCRYCPYECKSKRKMTSHLVRCEQNFSYETNLSPRDYGESDYPAITSKFILKDDIRTYEDTLKEIRLASYNPNILKIPGSHPMVVVPKPTRPIANQTLILGSQIRPNISMASYKHPIGSIASVIGRSAPVSSVSTNHNKSGHAPLLYLLSTQKTTNQPTTLGTLQYPQNQSSFTNGKLITSSAANVLMKQRVNQSGVNNSTNDAGDTTKIVQDQSSGSTLNPKGSTFVICEICDGYIKDLSQLKSHMQWIHKVKIHQKTLESRPPLNCQKCQWRFFTDQGLERHLLGAHGLVTSNMQEQVDKGSDSGRCTVCGRAYANKLVAHMRDVHKSNLKPAHLSYKCTVCSATFNLYRLFENHVYSVHSDSVRRMASN